MAVGSEAGTARDTTDPIAETFDGRSWQRLHPINDATRDVDTTQGVDLRWVSCASTTSCTALGDTVSNQLEANVAEHWNGHAWRSEPFPDLSDQDMLDGVSCPTLSFCVAVGTGTPTAHTDALAEVWHAGGSGWRTSALPATTGASGLAGVSCPTATFCLAVGSQTIAKQGSYVATEWTGHTWTRVVLPHTAESLGLAAVSCATSTFCGIIGAHGNTETTVMLEHGSWSVHPLPDIRTAAPYMNAISCPAAGYCYAVGARNVPGGASPQSTVASEVWQGTSWTPLTTPDPNPHGEPGSSLDGISCHSAAYCVTVGARSLVTNGDMFAISEVGGAVLTH